MRIATKTDKGAVRNVNQDSFAASQVGGKVWAVVCDGMGGANAGGIASANAVKKITDVMEQSLSSHMGAAYLRSTLQSSLETANAMLYDMAQKNEAYAGMGTTAVLTVVLNSTAYFAHVGDSRLYICRNGELKQLTSDHSIVQYMVENGQLTASEAKTHPRKNVITRAIGVDERISVDLGECTVYETDRLLLCSDGLTNYVDSDKILEVMKSDDFDSIPQTLIDLANNGGGGDNITAVVIEI